MVQQSSAKRVSGSQRYLSDMAGTIESTASVEWLRRRGRLASRLVAAIRRLTSPDMELCDRSLEPGSMDHCGHARPQIRRWIAAGARLGFVAALVATLSLTLTASPQIGTATRPMRAFVKVAASDGVNKAIWGPSIRDGVSSFPIYRELGTKVYEDVLRWNEIALHRPRHPRDPRDPAYVWPAEVTRAVAEAKRYGMQVALQIIGSPRWANGNLTPQWVPLRLRYYADFAYAASKRYPSVHLWMIWGEPDRSHNFRPLTPATPYQPLDAHQRVAPHLYARLLNAAYGTLKEASRSNIVIGGMTDAAASISPQQWIENMRLPDGKPPRLDMYGHNPFSIRAPNLANPPSPDEQSDFSDLARLNSLVDRFLGRPENPHPELFLSEWTIPTAPGPTFNYYVDPNVQAAWISDGLRVADELPSVYAVGWIPLYDELPAAPGGLIAANGHKKPGFFAWRSG